MLRLVGQYLALHFNDVKSAVEYCHRLVPHIVPRPGVIALDEPARSVVWLYVPRSGSRMARGGCYLFASPGAVRAAQAAQLETVISGVVPRSSLPPGSVLVFGEDNREPASGGSAPLREFIRRGAQTQQDLGGLAVRG